MVQTKPIFELFVLYSALNYNGYDKENNPRGIHPMRKRVRDLLEKRGPEKFDFEYHPYHYAWQVLSSEHTNHDFVDVLKYLEYFQKLEGLDQLWTEVETATEKELDLYRPKLFGLCEEVESLLDIPRAEMPITFTVNLLESYYRGFSLNYPDKTILITGPSDCPNLKNFVHELIHTYLYDKNLTVVNIEQKGYLNIPEELRKNYPPEKIVEESLVRALTAYLSARSKILINVGLEKQDRDLSFPVVFLRYLDEVRPEKVSIDFLVKSLSRFQYKKTPRFS
ncbi:hypothetical protein A2368_02115 [Candidatus Collierbacteria bacterium RIFOXYB1_FULL_49_13]|uniref:Uncharacterized protein n=1 Tax=Candidatus Collierbacteria bacterium RIFOXYB1_FULL_49_13 TaxID=1817728 RepID=A0A1F5FG83_9BACT|nr:MAG: hypothetical protein A2368_02115 [Candidatus Collierbacteria bacterium RIFOXYB1_FULL_49_13]